MVVVGGVLNPTVLFQIVFQLSIPTKKRVLNYKKVVIPRACLFRQSQISVPGEGVIILCISNKGKQIWFKQIVNEKKN